MDLVIAKQKLNPVHAKLAYQRRRDERIFQEALQKWFAFAVKQIQTDLRTKFQKDITSELTDWEYLQSQGQEMLKPATLSIMQTGGNEAYKLLEVQGTFSVLNPESVKAAEKFTANLVREVNSETKKGIRAHIATGIKEGKSMDKISREIRPLVGLTESQAQSVTNYKALLQDKDKFPGLSAADIDKKTNKYASKTHRRRTQNIARTETARAQNIGYATGMDDLGVTQLEFSRAPATGPPDECDALAGKRFSISEAKGIIPVHPNGRCAMLPVLAGKTVNSSVQAAEAMPEHLGDLVKRWEGAKSRSNKWVLKDKLRKLGYDTSGSPIGVKPPIITPPVLTPTVTPVGKLPQELQDLVARYQAAASRSSKWTYQNKLKQLGYNVKTGVYKPTGITVPKPIITEKPTSNLYATAKSDTYTIEIRAIDEKDLAKHLKNLRSVGYSESEIARVTPKGQKWWYKKGDVGPVKGGYWMDWPERHYPKNYYSLPKAKRALLEAQEQIDKWAKSSYEFHRARQIPKPKPKISEGVLPKSHFGKYEDWDKRHVTHKESLKQRMGFDLDVLKVGRTDTPEYKAALAKFEKALKSYTDPTMKLDYARKEFYTAGVKKFDNGFNKYCDILEDIAGNSALNHYNKKNIAAWVHSGRYRANASPKNFSVDFAASDSVTVQFHEYGHLLEDATSVRRKTSAWLRARSGHKPPMRYNAISGWSKDTQMAYKNKFIDPYVGKIYISGNTEVISMGMQQFTDYKRMLRFAKKDFDHFSLIHGILTGAI